MTEETVAFTMGRNQPYGHQHFAANDWMAEQIGADRLNLYIDTTHEERLPKSPIKGERMVEAVEQAYEDFYDVDYDVTISERDVLDTDFYTDLLGEALDGHTFVTGEPSHARTMERVFPGFDAFGYTVEHWDRTDQRFEDYDYDIVSSSTEIRQLIRNDDDRWRDAVSDPIEDAIDAEYETIRETIVPAEEYNGSKYKDIIASNGQPWAGVVAVHDAVEDLF
ncbi:MAG: hypothetical protein MUP66_03480 [Candidatus Nanohaloarchaeota archaeon QJJ-5]|nr:hypothetical protein [Candidatus Nanohaloarchaeota archaeon QJJ-5]